METTYVIRPHLYLREGAKEGVGLEEAVALMKSNQVALVNNLDLVFEILYALGWSKEDASFAVTYAMVGIEKLDNGQTSITST